MFAEDLDAMFSTSDFAVEALWNDETTISVIFDRAYVAPLGGSVVEGSGPAASCPAASVPGIAQGDTLEIDGTTYQVTGVEPDGSGLVLLRLEVA